MIAILMATRGICFAEVENAIEEMREETWIKTKVYRTFNKKIPDAQNYLVEKALKSSEISHLFFIEEDTVPPPGVLKKMIYSSEDIVFVDYPVSGYSCSARDEGGSILWAGLGCTMVKRQVFNKVYPPYFRTDVALRLNDWTWQDVPPEKAYGGLDIYFFTKAREAGCTIRQLEGECKHLELTKLGTKEINDGLHKIKAREPITKKQIINTH